MIVWLSVYLYLGVLVCVIVQVSSYGPLLVRMIACLCCRVFVCLSVLCCVLVRACVLACLRVRVFVCVTVCLFDCLFVGSCARLFNCLLVCMIVMVGVLFVCVCSFVRLFVFGCVWCVSARVIVCVLVCLCA